MTLPPVIKCKQCGRQLNHNIAAPYCFACGFRSYMTAFLVLFFVIGCNEQRKPRPNPDNHDVVIVTDSVKHIHQQSAIARADIYLKLADAVQAGSVKTVNDAMNFMNPMIVDAGKQYTIDINSLRNKRLGGAEDELPSNAAEVFRQFARDYREAAK